MPVNRDDIEQGNPPTTPPEGDIEELETDMPKPVPEPLEPLSEPEPVPEPVPKLPLESELGPEQEQEQGSSKWDWIGSPSRPEAQEESDGISDLFHASDEDVGASDEDLSDLTDVDMEADILDADEDGSLDDLVDVTEEDFMGDERGQRPSKPPSQQRRTRYRVTPRYQPPTSMGRSG